MSNPKQGTIERTVLDMLIAAGPAGLTITDFPPELALTAESMEEIITRLRYGLFESELDDQIKFDA